MMKPLSPRHILSGIGIMIMSAIVFCTFSSQKSEAINISQIKSLQGFGTDTLLAMAKDYGQNRHMPDSGLLCLDEISNRYRPGMTYQELRVCEEANNLMAYVLAMTYSNYKDAFSYLRKATDVCTELGDTSAMTLYNTGVIYHMADMQTKDEDFFNRATDSYGKAIVKAIADNDIDMVNNIIPNYIEIYASRNEIDAIAETINKYETATASDTSLFCKYNNLLLKGLKEIKSHNYPAAEEAFASQLMLTEGKTELVRYHLNTMLNLAKLYSLWDKRGSMLEIAGKGIGIAGSIKSKDCLMEFYKFLYEYFNSACDTSKAADYYLKYSRLREDVYSNMMTASLRSQRFIDELTEVKKDMAIVSERNHWQRIFLVLISFFLIMAVAGCVVIFRMHRRLQNDYNLLYDKNTRLIETEKNASDERRKLESYIEHLRRETDSSNPAENSQENENSMADPATAASPKKKFPFGQDESRDIYQQLRNLLENVDMTCNCDASLETFATALGTKPRYLSHIISEQSGKTFPQLLNESRIKEACRRINNDADYGNLTIEAIAESVGFKSRSHFAATFFKFTGLKPSMYQKISKERNLSKD